MPSPAGRQLLSLTATGAESENLELSVDYLEVVPSPDFLPGLFQEVILELNGAIAPDADNVLVRDVLLLELVVLMALREIQLAEQSQRRKQLQCPIGGGKADMRALLQQLAVKLLGREVRAVRLFAEDLEDRLALGCNPVPPLAQAIVDRVRERTLPGALVFIGVPACHGLGHGPLKWRSE